MTATSIEETRRLSAAFSACDPREPARQPALRSAPTGRSSWTWSVRRAARPAAQPPWPRRPLRAPRDTVALLAGQRPDSTSPYTNGGDE